MIILLAINYSTMERFRVEPLISKQSVDFCRGPNWTRGHITKCALHKQNPAPASKYILQILSTPSLLSKQNTEHAVFLHKCSAFVSVIWPKNCLWKSSWKRFFRRRHHYFFSPPSWINNKLLFCVLPCLSFSSIQLGYLNKCAYLVYVNDLNQCCFLTQRQAKSKSHLLHRLLPVCADATLEGPLSKCQPQQCERTLHHCAGCS